MTGYLTLWWVWLCIALAVGILEVLSPAFVFLGFAIGALVMAGVVTVFSVTNTAALLALFAVLSLFAWIALKLAFRRQSSGARVVTRDINEN